MVDMEKKYELLNDDFIKFNGRKLYRIRALRSFRNVKKGDLGGYIEKENNLSHADNAWVYDDARVSDNARVYDDAWVSNNAQVFGNARVYDDVWVSSNARVSDNAHIFGYARVSGNSEISGNTRISNNARVYGNANIINNNDYCCFSCFGSANRTTTAYKTKDGHVEIVCGCFQGTIEEFAARIEEMHGDDKFGREYKAIIEVIKAKFGINEI